MLCRTSSAALATLFLVAASAQAQDAPRGVIDWLRTSPPPATSPQPDGDAQWPPEEGFQGFSADGERIEIDESAAAADPEQIIAPLTPQVIDAAPVAGVVADSAGVLSEAEGGFPPDLWNGVPADRAGAILRQVRPGAVRSANLLARAALLTSAYAPAAAESDGEIITLRAQALLELGMPADALALLQASGLRTPTAMALQLDAAALTGDDTEVCARALRSGSLADMHARRSYCLVRTGAPQEASLALSTGRDLGRIREADGLLLEALIEPTWAEFARAPDKVQDLTPLRLAALDQLGVARPSDFGRLAPLAMRWADMAEDATPRDRLTAAEQLEEAGALSTETLQDLYETYAPAASGGVWGRVEAWRAANDALSPSTRADAASTAFDRASSDGRAGSMARLLAPLLEGERPTTSAGSQDVRRALAMTGNYQDAVFWFSDPPTVGQLVYQNVAAPTSAEGLGQAQIAALSAKNTVGDLASGQYLAALTAFGLLERESRFTATTELQTIIEALEADQPAEALFTALKYLEPGRRTRPEPFAAALTALIALEREEEARLIALEILAPTL